MDAGTDWRVGYQAALKQYIFRHGSPVDQNPSFYGWIADDYRSVREHLAVCPPVEPIVVDESEWNEFQGTFYEGDTTCRGIDATFSCGCGEVANRVFRWRGSFGELIIGLVNES